MKSPLFEDVDKIVRNAWMTGFRAAGTASKASLDKALAKGMAIGALLVSALWIATGLAP